MESLVPDLATDRPRAMSWIDYETWLSREWKGLLASDPEERAVHRFLEDHPVLLPGGLGDIGPGGHHGPELGGVFSEPPLHGLARNRRPDFMWVTRSTSLITPVCIEIEKPSKRWFTKDGRPTSELTQALDQLTDWKVWFSEPENQSIFRKTYLRGQYDDRQLLPQYVLIYGRAEEFDSFEYHTRPDRLRKKRDYMRRPDESFMTFDSLEPKQERAELTTLAMTSDGPQLLAIPPTLTTGPFTGYVATELRSPHAAVARNTLLSDQRKGHVVERWLHWQSVHEAPAHGLRTYSNRKGE